MSPGSSDGRRTANFSDSGLATRAIASAPANGSAAAASMNANVIASDSPHDVRTCRSRRSSSIRASCGGCSSSMSGIVAGSET